jgi:hypothetical protein
LAATVEQVVGNGRHLAVPPQRKNEVRPHLGQHLAVVGEGRWAANLRRAPCHDTGVAVLNGNELYIRHRDEMTQIGSVVERVPVADFDGRNANGHVPPLCDRPPSSDEGAILTSAAAEREVGPY